MREGCVEGGVEGCVEGGWRWGGRTGTNMVIHHHRDYCQNKLQV